MHFEMQADLLVCNMECVFAAKPSRSRVVYFVADFWLQVILEPPFSPLRADHARCWVAGPDPRCCWPARWRAPWTLVGVEMELQWRVWGSLYIRLLVYGFSGLAYFIGDVFFRPDLSGAHRLDECCMG